jgi:hypothetical protein
VLRTVGPARVRFDGAVPGDHAGAGSFAVSQGRPAPSSAAGNAACGTARAR